MNKLELTDIVANNLKLSKTDATKAVDAVIGAIENGLKKGEKVVLTGFGTFEVKTRAARQGKHPKTGATIEIPASKAVHFKEGKALKDTL
ncbi:MAG: HU family DNA-binding protein [Clostridia bacterium]|nr:HU family DNA-binding protein [Clostridia bacterium]